MLTFVNSKRQMKSIILNKKKKNAALELKPRVQFVVFKFLCVDYLAFCKKENSISKLKIGTF